MGFKECFLDTLKSATKNRGGQDAIRKKSGVKQSTLSEVCSGKTQNPRLDFIEGIINTLEDDEFISLVRNLRPHIAWALAKPGYREVKTYNIIGCKCLADLEQPDQFGKDRKLFTLRIPEKFFPSDFAVRFSGSSMDNVIPDKAAAGVTKEFDFRPGEIYLCELPVEGLTFKRVIFHPSKNGLEFKADTKTDPDSIPSHFYHVEEGNKFIVGRLTWVAYRK